MKHHQTKASSRLFFIQSRSRSRFRFPSIRLALLRDLQLLNDDTLGVGSAHKGVGLEGRTQVALLVGKVVPPLLTAVRAQLARGTNSTGLAHLDT